VAKYTNGGYLNEYVTPERLAELGRVISDGNRFQAAAVLFQGLALASYYFLLAHEFSFWTLVLEALFLSTGLGTLLLSSSSNPSDRRLSIGLTTTKAVLIVSAIGPIAALLSSNDPFAFLFFLPGPILFLMSYHTRRIVAHDVRLRKQRAVKVGTCGNLGGVVVDLTARGFDPSTRIKPTHVASAMLLFEGLTITSVLRANNISSHRLPYDSTLFWTSLLAAISITAVIGSIVAVGIELMRTRWNKAVTGRVKLDTLENSQLWFYGGNGAFAFYKLFDRPMITVEGDQRLIVAHYPGSFEVRTSSSSDFHLLVSVLQSKMNYGLLGRKVSAG
jgi:hypothetical protein